MMNTQMPYRVTLDLLPHRPSFRFSTREDAERFAVTEAIEEVIPVYYKEDLVPVSLVLNGCVYRLCPSASDPLACKGER